LSGPTLQRHSTSAKPLPAPIAKVVEGLQPYESYKHQARIVEMGLRLVKGLPMQGTAQEVARELLAQFPADAVAQRLADALSQRSGLSAGLGPVLERLAVLVAEHLPHALKMREAQLARALARRLDQLSAKRVAISGATGGLAGGFVACGVLLLGAVALLAFILSGRAPAWLARGPEVAQAPSVVPAPQVANVTQPVIIVANSAQGGTPVVFELNTLLGALATGEMGKQVPMDQPIPDKPLPGQKLPPCSANLFEEEIKGGCWMSSGTAKPPCRSLFRDGDKCYRPIAVDPRKGVGAQPETPDPQR